MQILQSLTGADASKAPAREGAELLGLGAGLSGGEPRGHVGELAEHRHVAVRHLAPGGHGVAQPGQRGATAGELDLAAGAEHTGAALAGAGHEVDGEQAEREARRGARGGLVLERRGGDRGEEGESMASGGGDHATSLSTGSLASSQYSSG